jgi:hypothetical protein
VFGAGRRASVVDRGSGAAGASRPRVQRPTETRVDKVHAEAVPDNASSASLQVLIAAATTPFPKRNPASRKAARAVGAPSGQVYA